MHVFSEAEIENGTKVFVHRVKKVIIEEKVMVEIESFANETSNMVVWRDQYEMPIAVLSGGSYPENIYDWIKSDTGPFIGGIIVEDQDDITLAKQKMIYHINKSREEILTQGFNSTFGKIDIDQVSLQHLVRTLSMLPNDDEEHITKWRLYDNSMRDFSNKEFTELISEINVYINSIFQKSWEMKSIVENLDSLTEVNNFSPNWN